MNGFIVVLVFLLAPPAPMRLELRTDARVNVFAFQAGSLALNTFRARLT